jgi:hypothetical protein
MAITNVMLDTSKPLGEKLDPEMVAEIEDLAPGIPPDGTITEQKLADHSVTQPKIAPGAVGSPQIAAGGIEAENFAPGAVDTPALADGSVTDEKAGTGVATAHDPAGNPVTLDFVLIPNAAYQALTVLDPNVAYLIY